MSAPRVIRVMVVDDSFFMRKAIERIFQMTDDIVVCESAASGEAALERLEAANPDLITMDVEMPGMGGIAAVRAIMAKRRVPILMVSARTERGAQTTVLALSNGAIDFVTKPTGGLASISEIAAELISKVRLLGKPYPVSGERAVPRVAEPSSERFTGALPARVDCIAIAVSTGGPAALTTIFNHLPPTISVPIVVIQHMPTGFTKPLADRLNTHSRLTIREVEDGARLLPGTVLIGAAGKSFTLERRGSVVVATLRAGSGSGKGPHLPSADELFTAVAEVYGRGATAFILTGMGTDGVAGLIRVKQAGGFVFGQSEESCTVYGMPRAAAEAGLVDQVISLNEVAGVITEMCGNQPIGR